MLHRGIFGLVQSRPITALPEPTGDVPDEWPIPRADCLYFRASIVEQLPDPLTPLFADLIRPAVPAGLNALMTELSPRTANLDVDFPTINGYAYYEYSRSAMARMSGITPSALRMLSRKGFVLDRWRDRALPAYRTAVASWSGQDPAQLGGATLLDGTRELLEAGCRYYTNVQMVIPMAATTELSWTGPLQRVRCAGSTTRRRRPTFCSASTPPRSSPRSRCTRWPAVCRGVPGLAEALERLDARCRTTAPSGVVARRLGAVPRPVRRAPGRVRPHALQPRLRQPGARRRPGPGAGGAQARTVRTGRRPGRTAARPGRAAQRITPRTDGPARPGAPRLARGSLAAAQHWAPIREDALAAMGLAWPTMRRLLAELGRGWSRPARSPRPTTCTG